MSMIIGALAVPVYAKKSTKTKRVYVYLNSDEKGAQVKISIPYDSDWAAPQNDVYNDYVEFETSTGAPVIAEFMNADNDQLSKTLCKYLSKKKYKAKLLSYLCEHYNISSELADTYIKIQKDGNGKYMVIINAGDEFGAIRALDSKNLLIYFTDNQGKNVSKTMQKKIIAYTKQVTIEKKTPGTVENDPEIDIQILDVKLDPDKVVFSQVYTNFAWGYQKQAMYIFGDGRIYSYDYAKNPGNIKDDISEENVIKYLKDTKAIGVVDNDYLLKMYSCAASIDPNAKFTTSHETCDYGQKNLYFHSPDGTTVKCASYGDVRYTFDDKYANMMETLWDNLHLHCKEI
jgi:hypothetical protein